MLNRPRHGPKIAANKQIQKNKSKSPYKKFDRRSFRSRCLSSRHRRDRRLICCLRRVSTSRSIDTFVCAAERFRPSIRRRLLFFCKMRRKRSSRARAIYLVQVPLRCALYEQFDLHTHINAALMRLKTIQIVFDSIKNIKKLFGLFRRLLNGAKCAVSNAQF